MEEKYKYVREILKNDIMVLEQSYFLASDHWEQWLHAAPLLS